MQEGLRAIRDTEVLKKIVSPRDDLSQRRQCELLGLNRSMQYYKPAVENSGNLELMRLMDEEYMEHPTKGVLGMVDFLRVMGILTDPKRVRRLLHKMDIMAIYPKRNLSRLGLARYIQWIAYLEGEEITISMDGKDRALDNVWIEHFWRTLK